MLRRPPQSIIPIFADRAQALVAKWRQLPEGTVVDVHKVMGNLTLDVIGLSAFGYEFRALDDTQENELRHAYGSSPRCWVCST